MPVRLAIDGTSLAATLLRDYVCRTPAHQRGGGYAIVTAVAEYTITLNASARLCLDSVDSPLERHVERNLEELHSGRYEKQRAGGNRNPRAMVIEVPDDYAEPVARAVYRALLQVTGHGKRQAIWRRLFRLVPAVAFAAAVSLLLHEARPVAQELGNTTFRFRRVAFASLGTPANGTIVYCTDCAAASSPCTGGGSGSFALRQAGAWVCPDGGGGGGGAPTDATYITQTSNGSLSAEQALASLSTGIVKVTNGTGVLSTAAAGDFPTLNQNTTGTAANVTGTVAIANGGTGQAGATAAFDALAPTTTQGDVIYHDGTDNVRLAKGTAGQVLAMNSGATAPEWKTQHWFTTHGAGDSAGQNPLSSTSYYFGRWSIFDPDTSYATHRTEVLFDATLVGAQIMVIVAGASGNPASNVTFSLRVNNTTDNAIGTIAFTNPGGSIETSSLNIALSAGDDFVIKFATPNWSTATPTAVYYSATLWWRKP